MNANPHPQFTPPLSAPAAQAQKNMLLEPSALHQGETAPANSDSVINHETPSGEPTFKSLPFRGEHKRAISSLSFAPELNNSSDALVCSASADGTAKIWALTQEHVDVLSSRLPGKSVFTLPVVSNFVGHTRGINDVTWNCNGTYIATASDDKSARLWDVETNAPLIDFQGHSNFVFSIKFNPQSNLLATGSFDETVKLWDVRCGECVSTLPAHSDPVTSVDFNRDGTCVASGSYDGLIRVWDTATGECLKTIYAEGNPPVSFLRFSPNGKFILSSTLDSRLRMWQVSGDKPSVNGNNDLYKSQGGRFFKSYGGKKCHQNTKFCAFSDFCITDKNHQSIVTGSEDGKLYIYDLQSKSIRQTLEGHSDAVLAVASHSKIPLLASGGMNQDKSVRFWYQTNGDDDSTNQ